MPDVRIYFATELRTPTTNRGAKDGGADAWLLSYSELKDRDRELERFAGDGTTTDNVRAKATLRNTVL